MNEAPEYVARFLALSRQHATEFLLDDGMDAAEVEALTTVEAVTEAVRRSLGAFGIEYECEIERGAS